MNDVIPTIYTEMATDDDNQSAELLDYYTQCNQGERTVINEVCLYLCGWSFETILAKCGIPLDEAGNIPEQSVRENGFSKSVNSGEKMNDKLRKWITALEEIKNNILNTLHYNGLILDDIDKVIKDIKETQGK